MICKRCKKEIIGNLTFCPVCGLKVEDSEITREQYIEHVELKDKNKAVEYIRKMKTHTFYFVLVSCLLSAFSNILTTNNISELFVYIALLIWYVPFYIKLLKLLNIKKTNAFWIIAAPFSFIYLYPLVVDELKIIAGITQPKTNKKTLEDQKVDSNKFWKNTLFKFITLFFLVSIILFVLVLLRVI